MSSEGKIKSKDLTYDSALPPFLQRLHAQKAGRGDTDRHERQIARPKRAKDPNDDDGPTVVDETGEIVSKEQFEDLTKEGEKKDEPSSEPSSKAELAGPDASEAEKLPPRSDAKVTDGAATKKRKAAKVIADDEGDEGGERVQQGANDSAKAAKKVKRKAKPIKLAFEDGDDT